MFAARQRAGQLARQLHRGARTYASEAHKAGKTTESFGTGSIITLASAFGGLLLYQVMPREGEDSAVTRMINKYLSRPDDWTDINAARVKAVEQASYDRNLFENASNQHRYVDVAYPEALHSHPPHNIRAGHMRKMDDVVEHFREKAAANEDRKAARMEAKLAAQKE